MNNRTRVYAMGSKVIETACDQLGNIDSTKSALLEAPYVVMACE